MSVPKLQVRLVRLIRFTMLDSLGVCLHLWIYERSQTQIQLTDSDRDPPTGAKPKTKTKTDLILY